MAKSPEERFNRKKNRILLAPIEVTKRNSTSLDQKNSHQFIKRSQSVVDPITVKAVTLMQRVQKSDSKEVLPSRRSPLIDHEEPFLLTESSLSKRNLLLQGTGVDRQYQNLQSNLVKIGS